MTQYRDREGDVWGEDPEGGWVIVRAVDAIDLGHRLANLTEVHLFYGPLTEVTDPASELDPERLEKTLRAYVSELDYDIHKKIECGEEDEADHYPEEVAFFLRCWDAAGS